MPVADSSPRLGVNIDHIATLREARKVSYPAPFAALTILKECSVDQVTIHLREDRRHIQDADLENIVAAKILPVNLEMAATSEMARIACLHKPHTATLVPEKRQEVTTEGGLDCAGQFQRVAQVVKQLRQAGIRASLFIDPDLAQVHASKEMNADAIELHTGTYCNIVERYFERAGTYDYRNDLATQQEVENDVQKIKEATALGRGLGLKVFAGHGLHCFNLRPLVQISEIEEYNIGHAIIARAVFVGLKKAIQEIQETLGILA
jgi:pyridoxine 5-phosphate synthase